MGEKKERQSVLVVDDVLANISVLGEVLSEEYEVRIATNGEDALKIAGSKEPPDLILLDVMMPKMDGYEVCARLKENARTRHIPIVFVTARNDASDEERGFALGAVDYIIKPISIPIVKARVATHLALYDQNRILEKKVKQRTNELNETRDVTIRSMAVLAEYRDNETGGHIVRTQHYVRILAEQLADHPRFRDTIGGREIIDLLFKSAPLHDIGKVGIPDAILLKPGQLTSEEFAEMQRYTIYGGEAMERAEGDLSGAVRSPFLHIAKEIAYTHHEKFDGSGYPNGLAGEQIPISGRLMAIADIYDALVSRRIYKPPFSHRKACSIIIEGDGRVEPRHFDPDVLAVFVAHEARFKEVALAHADSEEERQAL